MSETIFLRCAYKLKPYLNFYLIVYYKFNFKNVHD